MRRCEKLINKCIDIFKITRTDRFIIVLNGYKILFNIFYHLFSKTSVHLCQKYPYSVNMLRINIRTPLKVIFGTKSIIGGLFRLSTQYVSQLLTVLNQKLNKTVILTCRCSMCIKNESTGKYTCSHAPYTCLLVWLHYYIQSNGILRG